MPLIFSAQIIGLLHQILEPNIKKVYHIRERNKLLKKEKKVRQNNFSKLIARNIFFLSYGATGDI